MQFRLVSFSLSYQNLASLQLGNLCSQGLFQFHKLCQQIIGGLGSFVLIEEPGEGELCALLFLVGCTFLLGGVKFIAPNGIRYVGIDFLGEVFLRILGQLNNDTMLLARCVDYMSETMAPPVIEVNKFLASAAGKKAKKQLLNPPAYKPKKQKKPGMFSQAMAGGMQPPIQ